MKKTAQAGFTLIEIVIVLALLGILGAIAAPKYTDLTTKAQQNAVKAAVSAAQSEVNLKFASELMKGTNCDDALRAAQAAVTDTPILTQGDITFTVDTTATSATLGNVTITKPADTGLTLKIIFPECTK